MAVRQKYVDPTPEEIRERCLEIQSEWCDEVRAQREPKCPRTPIGVHLSQKQSIPPGHRNGTLTT